MRARAACSTTTPLIDARSAVVITYIGIVVVCIREGTREIAADIHARGDGGDVRSAMSALSLASLCYYMPDLMNGRKGVCMGV